MISTILAFLVFPLIIIFFLLFRKNPHDNLLYYIKNGRKCYKCGEDFNVDPLLTSNPKLCTSCKRDYSINELQNFSNFQTKLLYFFYSEKSTTIGKIILFSMVGLLVIGITVNITTGSDIGLMITNSVNILYWLYMISKELITRKALSKI